MNVDNSYYNSYIDLNNIFFSEWKREFIDTKIHDIVKKNLFNKDNYTFQLQEYWYYISNKDSKLPLQGWKIHISTNLINWENLLIECVKYLTDKNITFKVIKDYETLRQMFIKNRSRTSFGKFITIYPEDENHAIFILEELSNILKNFDGPYILSDRRYKNSKVVYYRYGGILPIQKIDETGVSNDYIFINNKFIIEERKPYYQLPNGIKDIQIEESLEENESNLLNNRFEIIDAINFSASGGIYLAEDKLKNKKVIVKEERPYTTSGYKVFNSIEREKEFLNKYKNYNFVPSIIDYFTEWEHRFLVIEYLGDDTLSKITSKINPLVTMKYSNYKNVLLDYWIQLTEILLIIHKNGDTLVDLSLTNIMVKDGRCYLIDFEMTNLELNDEVIYTPGFFDEDIDDKYKRDIYSLGCIFVSCIFPINSLIKLNKTSFSIILHDLCKKLELGSVLYNLICNIVLDKNMDLEVILQKLNSEKYLVENYNVLKLNYNFDDNKKVLSKIISRIYNNYLKNEYVVDPICYNTNKINFINGETGILYALFYTGMINKSNLKEYISNKINTKNSYPSGLYFGWSGLCWLASLTEDNNLIRNIDKKIIIHKSMDSSLKYGLSGIGLLYIKLAYITNDNKYKMKAISIGRKIIKNAIKEGNTCFWPYKNEIHLGLDLGNSGVVLFLLYLYKITGEDTYLNYSNKGLKYIMNNTHKFNDIYTIKSNDLKNESIEVFSPYLRDGSSGVIFVAIRLWKLTKDEEILNYINKLMPDIKREYTFMPTLYHGLGGLCNTLMDIYQFNNNLINKSEIDLILNNIKKYLIKYEDEYMFPGMLNFNVSDDFSNGNAGLVCLIKRYEDNKENFIFNVDELLHH